MMEGSADEPALHAGHLDRGNILEEQVTWAGSGTGTAEWGDWHGNTPKDDRAPP